MAKMKIKCANPFIAKRVMGYLKSEDDLDSTLYNKTNVKVESNDTLRLIDIRHLMNGVEELDGIVKCGWVED